MKDKLTLFPERTRRVAKLKPPTRPGWLHELAADEWTRLAPELTRLGLLDEVFAAGFATYCELVYRARQLNDLVDKLGMEKAIADKVFDSLLATQRQLLEFADDYMLTPASRSKHWGDFKPDEFKPAPGA